MKQVEHIEESQARHAIETGEFNAEIIGAGEWVVIVMTQDWCPQWAAMKTWIHDVVVSGDVVLYEFIYNTSGIFHEFMRFKETAWRNSQIPYLRYYRNGKLVRESNYVSRETFRSYLTDNG